MIPVERPLPDQKKIKTSDSFELCYLRHQYFRRAKYNPTEAEMEPYMKIVEHLTKNTFFTYANLFRSVAIHHDDIMNIGRVHLVSFLGLYAMEQMPEKCKEFSEKFEKYKYRKPEEKDFSQKNKANFTMFLKQRMEDLVRVCRQKARNIKGQASEEYAVFCGIGKPPKYPRKLLKDFEEFGYKKIDFAVFKSIRKKASVNFDATIFEFGGVWYVAFPLEQKGLDIEDFVISESNPYENSHNMQPDALYEEEERTNFEDSYHCKSSHKKSMVLRKFIARNKRNVQYKEEIATARKLLRGLGQS